MAIKVSGTTVIDNDRNMNVGIMTASGLSMPPQPITFSPADNSSDNNVSDNIVITYNVTVSKGSGNITLREGSASGTVIETIAVSSGNVSTSSAQVTINPTSNLPTGKDIYVVIDAGAFRNMRLYSETTLLDTYNFTTGNISNASFSPSDGATNQSVTTNIVITFSENIAKGSGNITIRSGSASGTVQQTIDVTSGAVSVSGTQATINPPSDLAYLTDTYIVVDAGCFTNTDGDAASGNALINTYNFTTEADLSLGDAHEGGYLICCSSNNYWIVAPASTEVSRTWYNRNDAVTTANNNAACGDWFIPTSIQLCNPGYFCKTYWDSYSSACYWSSTFYGNSKADVLSFSNATADVDFQNYTYCVRAFRCVTY